MRKSTMVKMTVVGALLLLLPRRSSKTDTNSQNSTQPKCKSIDE